MSRDSKVWWWEAMQTGSYEYFTQELHDFDVIPVYEKGVAK
jgi:hypothetical protein